MNKNIRLVDLSKAERKLYNMIPNHQISLNSAVDCDAMIDESLTAWAIFVVPVITSFVFTIITFALLVAGFGFGSLIPGAMSALCILSYFQTRKKARISFPRALTAYKNERFGNEENTSTEKSS